MLSEFGLEKSVERGREGGVQGFGEDCLWYYTIRLKETLKTRYKCSKPRETHFDQVDNHIPLTAVADQVAREVVYESVVQRSIRELNRQLKIVVALV